MHSYQQLIDNNITICLSLTGAALFILQETLNNYKG